MEIAKMMMSGESEKLHCTKIQDITVELSSEYQSENAPNLEVYDSYIFDGSQIIPTNKIATVSAEDIYHDSGPYSGKYIFSPLSQHFGKYAYAGESPGPSYSVAINLLTVVALDDTTRFRVSNKVEFSKVTDREGKRFTPIG